MSAAATSVPRSAHQVPEPQGTPGPRCRRGWGPGLYGARTASPMVAVSPHPKHFRLPWPRAALPSRASEEEFFRKNRHHAVIALRKTNTPTVPRCPQVWGRAPGIPASHAGQTMLFPPIKPLAGLTGAPTGSPSPLKPGEEPLYPSPAVRGRKQVTCRGPPGPGVTRPRLRLPLHSARLVRPDASAVPAVGRHRASRGRRAAQHLPATTEPPAPPSSSHGRSSHW